MPGRQGRDVTCVETDVSRVAELRDGCPVLDEPGMDDLLAAGLRQRTVRFSTDTASLADRDIVFVCVPTPTNDDGSVDLRAVEQVVAELAAVMQPGAVVAIKSTVPVGTCRRLGETLAAGGIHTVSNPEFLREGHAVHDFRHPERVVVGASEDDSADTGSGPDAAARVAGLYAGDADTVLQMTLESAELARR